jgi:4-amino-4-deoxy-L-arabinose transferase-like glycosyltransferase
MRRWFLVFMLVLLPAQYTWAAVAAYCRHEATSAAAGHVGHHEHLQAAAAADASPNSGDADGPQNSTPPDCVVCHGPVIAMTTAFDARLPEPHAGHPRHAVPAPVPAPAPTPPERPQWARLA